MAALLEGRTALVTGGTLGIGRGIAETLTAHGARVAVTGLTEDECSEARARGADAHVLDVRDPDACRAVVERVTADLGGLTVLAANAGIYPQARLADMTDDDLDLIVDVNLKGTVHAVQAAAPALAASGRGRVVVTSSITGNLTGYPGWAHYGATKAAQMGFVRTAAIELAPAGTTVNAVLPGNVLTPGAPGARRGLHGPHGAVRAAGVPRRARGHRRGGRVPRVRRRPVRDRPGSGRRRRADPSRVPRGARRAVGDRFSAR